MFINHLFLKKKQLLTYNKGYRYKDVLYMY